MTHEAAEGCPHEIRSRPSGRPDAWYAVCTCHWTGPERDNQAATIRDLYDHLQEMKEAVA